MAGAQGIPADRLVREQARRPGHRPGARPDPGGKQLPQVRRESSAGARGYMQVMPFWTRVIGDGDAGKLFHMQTNLRFGCVILRHYLDRERGDLFMALGRYNGSRGKPPYPNAVFAAAKNWEFSDLSPAESAAGPGQACGQGASRPELSRLLHEAQLALR